MTTATITLGKPVVGLGALRGQPIVPVTAYSRTSVTSRPWGAVAHHRPMPSVQWSWMGLADGPLAIMAPIRRPWRARR